MTDIFLHIPKTGGSSLRTALRFVYGWQDVYTSPTGVVAPHLVGKQMPSRSYDLVRGHFTYGVHSYVGAPWRYFSMLRDPVPRILSLYHYIRNAWPESEVADMTLREFVHSGHHAYKHNDQTRRLAGPPFPDNLNDARTFDRACKHLDENITFGLTERFDESMVLFRRSLGWTRPPLYIRTNTNQQRPTVDSVDDALLNELRSLNALDVELYAYAAHRFDERRQELEGFDQELRWYHRMIAALGSIGPPILSAYRFVRRASVATS